MKTPEEFAERYMQRDIYLPFMSNMSSLLYIPDMPAMSDFEKIYKKSYKDKIQALHKTRLHSLQNETIDADINEKILTSLNELTEAMIIDTNILKKLNRDFIKKRKDAILCLEKMMKNPLLEKRQVIVKELKRLKAFDKNSKPYKEIDFISSWHHVFYTGLLKKLILKVEARKLSEMLSIHMSFRKGRLQIFFMKVLQIIVFRYLYEYAKLPREKAQCLAGEVVDEYVGKKDYPDSASICFKDIDNARSEL